MGLFRLVLDYQKLPILSVGCSRYVRTGGSPLLLPYGSIVWVTQMNEVQHM